MKPLHKHLNPKDGLSYVSFETPLGLCFVETKGGRLSQISFRRTRRSVSPTTPFERHVAREIGEFLRVKRRKFHLPYRVAGTPFQKAVWRKVSRIPYGETRTYGEIAKSIGRLQSSRAVGNAVGKNPLPLVIPCHRVVGANGLGGFSMGLKRKRHLLDLERTF